MIKETLVMRELRDTPCWDVGTAFGPEYRAQSVSVSFDSCQKAMGTESH